MVKKIKIVAIGKIREKYIGEGCKEYLKRLVPLCRVEVLEIKDRGTEKERNKLIPHISPSTFVLDEKGKQYTSYELADILKTRAGEITFIIGGPEGISEEIKAKGQPLALSKMTLLHEMTRLILLEQIYRAFMILNNKKYHRE